MKQIKAGVKATLENLKHVMSKIHASYLQEKERLSSQLQKPGTKKKAGVVKVKEQILLLTQRQSLLVELFKRHKQMYLKIQQFEQDDSSHRPDKTDASIQLPVAVSERNKENTKLLSNKETWDQGLYYPSNAQDGRTKLKFAMANDSKIAGSEYVQPSHGEFAAVATKSKKQGFLTPFRPNIKSGIIPVKDTQQDIKEPSSAKRSNTVDLSSVSISTPSQYSNVSKENFPQPDFKLSELCDTGETSMVLDIPGSGVSQGAKTYAVSGPCPGVVAKSIPSKLTPPSWVLAVGDDAASSVVSSVPSPPLPVKKSSALSNKPVKVSTVSKETGAAKEVIDPVVSTERKTVTLLPSLKDLLDGGIISPGRNVLSMTVGKQVHYGSLTNRGWIQSSSGDVYNTPVSWYRSLNKGFTVSKLTIYHQMCFKGIPLLDWKLPCQKSRNQSEQSSTETKEAYPSTNASLQHVEKMEVLEKQAVQVTREVNPFHKLSIVSLIRDEELIPLPGDLPENFWTCTDITKIKFPIDWLDDVDYW